MAKNSMLNVGFRARLGVPVKHVLQLRSFGLNVVEFQAVYELKL